MGRLQTKVAKCQYRHPDRLLTEQFIGRQNDDGMADEILIQVTTLENIEEVTSECVLGWVHRTEAQRSMLNNMKEAKDFDTIWQNS